MVRLGSSGIAMAVDAFADRPQTNIQLYGRLLDDGRSADELRQIRDAYNMAAKIFAGQIRPEGRPFICHLVGVAGILAALGEAPSVICAGLLHSALSQGDFGTGRGLVSGAARRLLARSVDPRTFTLVDGYDRLAWNADNLSAWTVAGSIGDETLRTLIVMRLANELEDALDRGLDFSEKGDRHYQRVPPASIVALARVMGNVRLVAALEATLSSPAPAHRPSFLQEHRQVSLVEAPLSYRRKKLRPMAVRLKDYAERAARRLRQLLTDVPAEKPRHRPAARDPK
jgi:hypothetical protein